VGESAVHQLVARLTTLPTLPPVYQHLCAALDDPDVTPARIGALIGQDPTLTARLLRMVNSAFFGYPEQIASISRAVTIIGFEALRNLILATAVLDTLVLRGPLWGGFSPGDLWHHSLATAVAARAIARRVGPRESEEFFVAGLRHDIGKLAMLYLERERYLLAIDLALNERILIGEAEARVFGISHPRVGQLLVEAWQLPRPLVMAVALHHQPTREAGRLVAVVHVADILARALALGSGGDGRVPPLAPDAWEALGLRLGDIAGLLREIEQDLPLLAGLLRGVRRTPERGEAA
jgi:putative nucleotidyltransferase with HDIG domain